MSRRLEAFQISRRHLLIGVPAWAAAANTVRGQARPEKSTVRLALGGKTTVHHLPLTLAEQLGYFKAEGLEVELQDQAGGGLAAQALMQDQADVAGGGFEHPVMMRQRGVNARAFVFMGRAPQTVFGVSMRTMPDFRRVAELRGKRVGISSPDSSTHWFASLVLGKSGVAPTEVEFVPVGTTTAAVAALREGRIDALSNIDPAISMLEFRNELRVLSDTRSLRGTQEVFGGPMVGGCLYAPQAYLMRNPHTVQALTNAVVRSLKWLQTAGPSDIVRAVPEAYMHGDRAIYLAAFGKAREAFSPDGMASEEGVRTAIQVMAQEGMPAASLRPTTVAAIYTAEFARRAKQRYQA